MQLTDVISISGVPDGTYIVWAQINAFSLHPGQFTHSGLYDGTTETGYTIEDETSANLTAADPVFVGALTLSGGSSAVHVT